MIVVFILLAIFNVINWIIGFLPDLSGLPDWIGDFLTMAGYVLNLFPDDVWIITLVNIGLWKFGFIGWALVEWVYKKIPGVD